MEDLELIKTDIVSSLANVRIPLISRTPFLSQRRHASDGKGDIKELHPILESYYQKRPAELQNMISGQDGSVQPSFGKMPDDTIFGELEETKAEEVAETETKTAAPERFSDAETKDDRNLDVLNHVLDPLPLKRWRWERARMIKDSRRGFRLSKGDYLTRTERKCASNSAWLKTSTKKLSLLARQIAGKSIDEALLQLRFSVKRPAIEVAKHLEHARNEAIVKWGMGLGEAEDKKGDPITIKLKDGKKRLITDRTALYIEQAMVQRGTYELQPEYRARGKMNILKKPYTGKSTSILVSNDTLLSYDSQLYESS
jgi:ribosomal protein L22